MKGIVTDQKNRGDSIDNKSPSMKEEVEAE